MEVIDQSICYQINVWIWNRRFPDPEANPKAMIMPVYYTV